MFAKKTKTSNNDKSTFAEHEKHFASPTSIHKPRRKSGKTTERIVRKQNSKTVYNQTFSEQEKVSLC